MFRKKITQETSIDQLSELEELKDEFSIKVSGGHQTLTPSKMTYFRSLTQSKSIERDGISVPHD
ncbi:hypothetical protein [Algicola sagamiensis]|uniref:hypothetical protein n=1 Tax=Algicola sagamiensis TaxID=163869 RepID=UPI00036390AB|nr:hypothetical protein [Algicola sagamiensis]